MNKIISTGILIFACVNVNANTIVYNDFSDLSGFQLNGSAASISNPGPGNVLRLTDGLSQSGSAFLTNTISLSNEASFSAAFDFRITDPQGISDNDGQGADGIVFVVQTVSNTAGGAGGGIGYSGLTNSVGIEFDTWNNGSWDDNDGNHVGINVGGNINSEVQGSIATRMNNSDIWSAWIDYDGLTDLLEVRISNDGNRSALAFLSYTVDLESELGTSDAFVGFTSGTGAAGGDHDILNMQFRNDFLPIIDAPEPTTLALLSLGLFGLGFNRRKNV